MQAHASTPGDVPESVQATNAAVDGIRAVMSIHAQWMLWIMDTVMRQAKSGIRLRSSHCVGRGVCQRLRSQEVDQCHSCVVCVGGGI